MTTSSPVPRSKTLAVTAFTLFAVLLMLVGFSFWMTGRQNDESCQRRQGIYDAKVDVIDFAADRLHATPEQKHDALAALVKRLGHRPAC